MANFPLSDGLQKEKIKMAGKGKPNFLQAMAVLKGKTIKGLAPAGNGPSGQGSKISQKKIFGRSTVKNDKKGGNRMKDVQNY